ncbi:MAG: aminotransferase class V-fold PLP-dependent enzyme [Epsilonproteobacteria bacterium]|nr:aminotransferase DegT [Campylobacterota bacterium]NPA56423.1 aminotransferase class V-fold PLP-dependent enzyme [Campylobacterota bacterium]
MKIFLSPPHMTGRELEYIEEVFRSNYIAPVGEYLERFEDAVRTYTGTSHALALCNGTAGIHLALRLLGVEEGDRVGVSNFTFVASLSPILYQRAEPILIDCDESWQIDLNLVEESFKKERPKVLIVTHLYGGIAQMEELSSLCDRYGVELVEDGAEALGTLYRGRHSGTFGAFGIYSFNGNKLLTTGGGGILVGRDERLMARARLLASQAKEPHYPWYEHRTYGYNYRLSNVLAAIGVAQMEVVEERVAKKREIFGWYREKLGEIADFMPELPGSRINRWLTTLIFKELDPLQVYERLKEKGIESRPLWKPMSLQPAFRDLRCYSRGVSRRLFEKGLCLPSGTQLEREEVEWVCHSILS